MTHVHHPATVEPPHADVDYLGDFLDGVLAADERDALAEHLACCAACRARLGALRLLIEQAAHAPVGIEPGEDLWPGIHAAIESRRTLSLPGASSPARATAGHRWRVVAGAVAAAAAIAVTSSLVTLRALRSAPPATAARSVPPPARGAGDALVRYAALERDYDRSARDLWSALDAERGTLSPATVATVERSVATIDRAIAEARQALHHDPGNRVLVEMLTTSHEHKLDLLRRATQLSSGT